MAQQNGSTSGAFANGTIISSENATLREELRAASKSYDENMVGVFYENSKVEYNKAVVARMPVTSSGVTFVKYNSESGAIKKGDLITSSSTPGEAMKATKSGVIIGIALEDAPSSSGLVKARIMIQYVKQ